MKLYSASRSRILTNNTQALVLASSSASKYHSIPKLTAGIFLLGTPHRGSKTQPWGKMVVKFAAILGFNSERGLLKHVEEDSDSLHDLVHYFTMIVGRMSTPVVCFYELYESDYGSRIPVVGGAFRLFGTFKTVVCTPS